MTSTLTVTDLNVRFSTEHATVHAVNGVSFSVERGQTVAIVGESGSGKSVTCLSLLRLLPRSAQVTGSVQLDGRELLTLSEQEIRKVRGRGIGLVYQDPMAALNPVRTIGAQVAEPLRLHLGLGRREAAERAADLLGTVGIPAPRQQLKAYPHEFSGGMRQRVVIAMAVACQPQVLLADEPTTALDVSVQAQILELLKNLTAELGISLILVSHDLSVVAGLADDVLVMYGGFLAEQGDAVRVFEQPAHPYTAGLLASIPDTAPDPDAPLIGIAGQPPDGRSVPVGCVFQPRCPHAFERCGQRPPLEDRGPSHRAACWLGPEVNLGERLGSGAA
jgi:peptide/nickel transport system ATP-binding protein/oligopeptide transport system ATP-binding protein